MELCYMCDQQGTTDEHVPPKCLFPEQKDLPEGEDLRKNLITVPACDQHNTKKSKDDEYVLYCLAVNLPANSTAERQFNTKIMRAIDRNPSAMKAFVRNQIPLETYDPQTREASETAGVRVDERRLNSTLGCMARALFLNHYGERWLHKVQVEPEFLLAVGTDKDKKINERTKRISDSVDRALAAASHYGENPEVFTYQILEGDARIRYLMRMHFYGRCRVTAAFRERS